MTYCMPAYMRTYDVLTYTHVDTRCTCHVPFDEPVASARSESAGAPPLGLTESLLEEAHHGAPDALAEGESGCARQANRLHFRVSV